MGTFLFRIRIFSLHENGQKAQPMRLAVVHHLDLSAMCVRYMQPEPENKGEIGFLDP